MSKDAYEKLQKKMDAATEAQVAEYIMRDMDLRQQNAEGIGCFGIVIELKVR